MLLLIGLLFAGCMIALYFRFFTKGTAIVFDRKSVIKEESMTVSCTKCHTVVKRQRFGQQCPECRLFF